MTTISTSNSSMDFKDKKIHISPFEIKGKKADFNPLRHNSLINKGIVIVAFSTSYLAYKYGLSTKKPYFSISNYKQITAIKKNKEFDKI